MTEHVLVRLFEHNNWTNLQIIQACCALSDEQLDAEPLSATKGSIRQTLWHLVGAQQGYLSLLTGTERRFKWEAAPPLAELEESVTLTGEALLALASDESGKLPKARLRTNDGYTVEPWVIMVQVINHATEHREQIKSMLSSLGATPPEIDGWNYGLATDALTPLSS
jgi:uncharacterized damage-inducible protein DinB